MKKSSERITREPFGFLCGTYEPIHYGLFKIPANRDARANSHKNNIRKVTWHPGQQQHIKEFEAVKNQMNESLEGLLRFVDQISNPPAIVEISFPYSASSPKSQDRI